MNEIHKHHNTIVHFSVCERYFFTDSFVCVFSAYYVIIIVVVSVAVFVIVLVYALTFIIR